MDNYYTSLEKAIIIAMHRQDEALLAFLLVAIDSGRRGA
jgi:hypothetical protein